MKLRECIEAIEEHEECSRQDAIFIMINEDAIKNVCLKEIYCCIYANGLTKIQELKLKNKFERRLIKLAERMENNNAI